MNRYEAGVAFHQACLDIATEIELGNIKHGDGPMASPVEVVAILTEELGEYAQAILKDESPMHKRQELIQLCAVAINHLIGTGPHISTK